MTMNKEFMQIAEDMTGNTMLALCGTIVGYGLALRSGRVAMRDNDTMQNVAEIVRGLPSDQLEARLCKPTGKHINDNAALMISMCHTYYRLTDEQNAEYGQVYIDRMAEIAAHMVRFGWNVEDKPFNFDVDAQNNKLPGYREPTGVSAEFARAFNMEYKKPVYQALEMA